MKEQGLKKKTADQMVLFAQNVFLFCNVVVAREWKIIDTIIS